jgi:tetratricopeptide (TPR) repeat protein
VAFMEVQDFKIAARYFEDYVVQNSKDEIAFFLLGKCYFETGDYPAALLALQRANRFSKRDHRILYYIGKSLSGLDEELDAARTFREALKIDPDDPEIYFALGKSYYRLNKNKKVKETLDILNMLDRTLYNQLRSELSGH